MPTAAMLARERRHIQWDVHGVARGRVMRGQFQYAGGGQRVARTPKTDAGLCGQSQLIPELLRRRATHRAHLAGQRTQR